MTLYSSYSITCSQGHASFKWIAFPSACFVILPYYVTCQAQTLTCLLAKKGRNKFETCNKLIPTRS